MTYRKTLFDRHGPEAVIYIKAASHGLVAFGLGMLMFGLAGTKAGYVGWKLLTFTVGGSLGMGLFAAGGGIYLSRVMGAAVHEVMVSGSATPYQEQFSFEQSLVMQRKIPEALASFEKHIATPGSGVDVRIRAAELYATGGANPRRAAELFREARSHPGCTVGQDVYVSNRLVDLLNGPLAQSGRALVELRRLVDRYPNSAAGMNARAALAELKASQSRSL